MIAKALDRPIVIHSRDAFDATIKTLDAQGLIGIKSLCIVIVIPQSRLKLSIAEVEGLHLPIVTYKNAPKVQKALLEQGVDTLMIETDSPYLTPEPHRGQKMNRLCLREGKNVPNYSI